jgi:hypothetical protein
MSRDKAWRDEQQVDWILDDMLKAAVLTAFTPALVGFFDDGLEVAVTSPRLQ